MARISALKWTGPLSAKVIRKRPRDLRSNMSDETIRHQFSRKGDDRVLFAGIIGATIKAVYDLAATNIEPEVKT